MDVRRKVDETGVGVHLETELASFRTQCMLIGYVSPTGSTKPMLNELTPGVVSQIPSLPGSLYVMLMPLGEVTV